MKANSLVKTVYSINPKTIVSVCAMMLLICGIQGIGYAIDPVFRDDDPNTAGAQTTRSVAENTRSGENIGAPVVATDNDPGDVVAYSIPPATDFFTIVSTSGQLQVDLDADEELDHETAASHTVVVTATDSTGGTATITVTINVTNVNEAPEFADGTVADRSVAENSISGTNIGNPFSAPDPDGDDVTYSLNTGGSSFNIDMNSGQLTTRALLDHEGQETYTVIVKATDDGSPRRSATFGVTITVTDVNEDPSFTRATDSFTINENLEAGTLIGRKFTAATDDDDDDLTYSLAGPGGSAFEFEAETNADDETISVQLKTMSPLDFETRRSYTVLLNVRDNIVTGSTDGSTDAEVDDTITVTITLRDVNDKPVFTDEVDGTEGVQIAPRSVNENTAANISFGAAIGATDEDRPAQTLRFRLTDSSGNFGIDSTSGQLKTIIGVDLDYEEQTDYTVTVTVTDNGSPSASASMMVTITVDNDTTDDPTNAKPRFNDGPTASREIPENSGIGEPIGAAVGATDDGTGTLAYTLASGVDDNDSFAIVSTSGQLQTKAGVTLNHEAKDTYTVTVRVTDGLNGDGNASNAIDDTITVTITVTDVNEKPTFDEGTTAGRRIAENTDTSSAVSLPPFFTATDPDEDETLGYILGGADASSFSVDSKTGELEINKETMLDVETQSFYIVSIGVYDGRADDGTEDATAPTAISDATVDNTITVTITVTGEDEAPAFPSTTATFNQDENADVGTVIGTVDAATDPEGATVSYTYGGTHASSFTFDTDSRELKVKDSLDFEGSRKTYTVTVTASDGTNESTITITINVINVDEAPMFARDSYTFSVLESITESSIVGVVVATDPDVGDTSVTYSDDSSVFDVNTATGQLSLASGVTLDYEMETDYAVTVTAADADVATLTDTAMVTINVRNVSETNDPTNREPVFSEGASTTRSINEVKAGGTSPYIVGYKIGRPVVASDPNGGDVLEYTLSHARFSIDSSTGQLTIGGSDGTILTPDHETTSSYTLEVGVKDNKGADGTAADTEAADDTITVTINVIDLNEPPTFPTPIARTVTENAPADEFDEVVVITADSDPEGDDVTYSLTDDAGGKFTIDSESGQLSTTAPLDADGDAFDADADTPAATYTIKVTATDDGTPSASVEAEVTVTITPINDNDPVFSPSKLTWTVPENAPSADIGIVPEATDADKPDQTLTYDIGGTDAAAFDFTAATRQLSKTSTAADYEAQSDYEVTITATDDGTPTRTGELTIVINVVDSDTETAPANSAPKFTLGTSTTFTVAENTAADTVIGTVEATDANSDDTLAYSLTGDDTASFTFDDTTKQLKTKASLDHETKDTYTVTVEVKDNKDAAGEDAAAETADDTIRVVIEVTDVNEKPFFTEGASAVRSVNENTRAGVNFDRAVIAADEDEADAGNLKYSLIGSSDNFEIDADTGQFKTKTGVDLDYETQTDYLVTVGVSDQRPNNAVDATIAVTIKVLDLAEAPVSNRAPVFPSTSITFEVEENTAANTLIGTVPAATDADLDGLTYARSGADSSSFTFDPATRALRTKASLDHETKDTYTVTVTATDDGSPRRSDTIRIIIMVTDVNEAPTFPTTTGDVYVYEGPIGQDVIDPMGRLTAKDPDSGDTLTYSLDTDSQTVFGINANTGALTTVVALDYEATPPKLTYTVTVSVSDGKNAGGAVDSTSDASTTVTIDLKDVTEANNNPPRFIASTATAATAITAISREVVEHVRTDMAPKNVGDPILAKDDDTGTTLSYTLGGADADSFTIESTLNGVQLKTAVALDYDGEPAPQRTYTVMITVSDGNTADDATITVTIALTNDPSDDSVANNEPEFVDGDSTTRSVVENAANANVGLPVSANDGDNDPLTYSLDATSEASFSIDSNGQLTTDIALDFEGTQIYTVTVSVTDGMDAEGNAETTATVDDSITVTVNVTNDTTDDGTDTDPTRNDPPRFTGSTTRSVQAGTTTGRNVGSRVTATDPEGDTLTYALTGGHTSLFGISNTGQLTTLAAVTAGSYSVTVRVTDDGTPPASATTTITITVTTGAPDTGGGQPPAPQPLPDGGGQQPIPVTNDPPTFDDGTSATRSVAENTPAGTNIGAPVGATDPNNDPLTYTLGGADAASFSIDGTSGQLMTSAALDFEVKRVYTVTVTANDGLTGGTAAITVTINVTDVSVADGDPVPTNNAPVFPSETAARSVAENTAAGGNIGAPVAATDTDAGEVLTYTLGGTDMASFDINGATGQLMVKATLDHETKASYTVMVTATDRGGLTDSITVEITVTNVNEAPAFADATAARSVDENTAAGMAIGDAFTATDPDDGDTLTYSLGGTDMASFAIGETTGQLMTQGMLDHETKASHTVMVIATDSGGLTGSITVTISVMDVNDAPRFASATATRMVEENTASGMAIGAPVMAMDDDGDNITYSLGGTDMGSFAIDTATGQLKTMADLDYEAKASHTVMVTASDGTDMSSITVTITVTDVPEFMLSVPAGQSLIHVPLKMAGLAKISDLYDKLGGATNVNLLITYDTTGGRWLSYLGDQNRGRASDRDLTDDLGILADMKNAVTVQLSGDALGTDGTASIALAVGSNLVGVPLKDSRITNVSDLLALDDNVSFIIVSDGGEYKTITRAGDPGDVAVTGGQAFILNATAATTITITGDGWASSAASSAPSWISQMGIQKDGVTAALAVTGSIVDEVKGLTDFHITVKNLSTGKVDTVATNADVGGSSTPDNSYQLTFVDIETGRAAQVGDILEITAQSADPLVGVEPLRYVVTVDDVNRGHIQLDTLVTYEVPAKTELLRNYPNPFNPETWIPYRLAKDASVTLTIYNQNGGVVRDIHIGHQIAAVYETRSKAIYWDGRNNLGERVASGIYFYHLTAGTYSATRKMVILK